MSRYLIPEENMESLRKKVTCIQNKCRKYNNEFKFEIIGEELKDITFGDNPNCYKLPVKFYEVEVEGIAKINGWVFVGVINHTESGNVIFTVSDKFNVPERYRKCKPNCEHCNRRRSRKDTFLIFNEETGEYKQVGKSCLKDYTNGLDANSVARFESYFKEVEEMSYGFFGSCVSSNYYVKRTLLHTARIVNQFGYKSRLQCYYNDDRCTSDIVKDIIHSIEGSKVEFTVEEITYVDDMVDYLLNVNEDSNFISNLKMILSVDIVSNRHFGLLVSAVPTYNRMMESERRLTEREDEIKNSDFVGTVGDKIRIRVVNARVVYSYETQFGFTYINKFVDDGGNVFIWKTSKSFNEDDKGITLVGTLKNHEEYRGVKQNILTRCKVVA